MHSKRVLGFSLSFIQDVCSIHESKLKAASEQALGYPHEPIEAKEMMCQKSGQEIGMDEGVRFWLHTMI